MARRQEQKPAALYVRVSSERQGEADKVSLPEQERQCREHALASGLTVDDSHIYRETHSARDLFERPALTRLREAVRRKLVGAVVVYDPDRFVRDQDHLGYLLTEFRVADVGVRFVHRDPGETPEGRMMLSFVAYAAEVERKRLSERLAMARRARAQAGKLVANGQELYGYRRVPGENRREVFEPEAAIVREIYEALAEGLSLRRLCERLNARGLPSPAASRGVRETAGWRYSSLSDMVRNPAYRGEEAALRTRSNATKKAAARPREEWVTLAGVTPALVDEDLWERANARLPANRGDRTRNETRPYALRGLVVCGRCGKRMYPDTGRNFPHYRCGSRMGPEGSCGAALISARELEAWAWEWAAEYVRSPEVYLVRALTRPRAGETEKAVATATKELVALRAREERLLDMLEHDRVTSEQFDHRMNRIRREQAEIEERLAPLQAEEARTRTESTRWEEAVSRAQRHAGRMDTTNPGERWEILRDLGVQVTAQGGAKDPERRWEIRLPAGEALATTNSKQRFATILLAVA